MEDFRKLLENSERTLVTSHISPDVDAVSSALLALNTLSANFPKKEFRLVLEERPSQDLSFLHGYEKIDFGSLVSAMESFKPALLIIIDANKFDRISRDRSEAARDFVQKHGIKTVTIDHHELHDKEATDIYINDGYPASAEQAYHLLFDEMDLKKPEGYIKTTLLGILSDTNRFKYKNPKHRETFALVSDLIDAGGDIESLENRLQQYTKPELEVVSHLIGNLASGSSYSYSFISDEFVRSWRTGQKSPEDFKMGCDIFINRYIRNVTPNRWGFVVYPELEGGERNYSVSFRSEAGVKDVSLIAAKLGGGGHKPAAGAKFHAESLEDALKQVVAAIAESA